MRIQSFVALILVYVFLGGGFGWAQEQVSKDVSYSYYYKGSLIFLSPSKNLIAVNEKVASFSSVVSNNQLTKDPLSERYAIKSRSIGLYRASTPKGKKSGAVDLSSMAATLSGTTSVVVQPVFEQEGALLIPFDEVIVGFKDETSLSEAKNYLSPHLNSLGILELREHREKTFIVRISNPTNGRAFEVARSLAGLEKVSFSEPNFILVMLGDNGSENPFLNKSVAGEEFVVGYTGTEEVRSNVAIQAAPNWTTIASLDFESAGLPMGWQIGILSEYANASWGATTYRKHSGSRSLYCAALGAQAVNPPGPVPINMAAVLLSPLVNLSQYEEVYVELWFYAKNEIDFQNGSPALYDYPVVLVVNNDSETGTGEPLAVAYDNGDCTLDPTTSNGWRRVLFRVPPSYRVANAFFLFGYISDGAVQTEGAYIDDIRIVATSNVDAEPLSNDTYSARQYELKNVGQIAGLVNNRSDLHIPEAWGLVTVSPEIIVAVIDGGVELTHPDLNLVTGYDPDGRVGGQPRGNPRGSHGTNCAGNVGAIKDNGIGVVGTAPGVKIMPVYRGETTGEFANAIDVAVAHGAQILSNSWGWVGAPSADIENAVKAALAAGRTVLFAAGNGPDRPPYTYDVAFPGNLTATTDVICVGASSPTDEHKSASSSDGDLGWGSSYLGAGPDVCAPGPWSYSTDLLGAEGDNEAH